MNKWAKFWSGLNIRKALSLLFGMAMIVMSIVVVVCGVTQDTIDKDLIVFGMTGVTSVTTTLIGYYFGYSNGLKENNTRNLEDQL